MADYDRDAEALCCRGPKIEKWWPINKATDIKANEPLAMQ
jgi:hypothetical protein